MKKFYLLLSLITLFTFTSCQDNEIIDVDSQNKLDVEKINEKVDICHYDADMGVYISINISANAVEAHMAHGDKYLYSPEGSYVIRKTIDRGEPYGKIIGDYYVDMGASDESGDFIGTGIRTDLPHGQTAAFVNFTGHVNDDGTFTVLMEQWIDNEAKTGSPQNYWDLEGYIDGCSGIAEIHWVSGLEGTHDFSLVTD